MSINEPPFDIGATTIRIDSVHQVDQDKRKGAYHINAVDQATQPKTLVTVKRISRHFMAPALEQILEAFPFTAQGFHADNGLAETRNGAVVRKLFGYAPIPQQYAADFVDLNRQQVYRHISFHRPCHFPTTTTDSKSKERKQYHYGDIMTPYEKLRSLPQASQYLKPGITLDELDAFARKMTDNEAAEQLGSARDKLFTQLHEQLQRSV